jgi:trimethylamine--corrinoid protein Co-methyltransferase
MMDFESCFSLEKLIADNEICGMLFRMLEGIKPKEDFPSLPLFEELLAEEHLLISKHTMKYLKEEHFFPGPIINRANRSRWQDEGSSTFEGRAHQEVSKLITKYEPSTLSNDIKIELVKLMENEASKFGQDSLPEREL